ncbi:3'-5' ssDNA/RNA exonuclease TatD [Saliniradius amylolyticus]|uniref:3'-5' ssDNA/RNA exonuclease TatD n=1 Tax=Saliniradius amylolyticus TaxID=2183582 RepID=A0A2S2E6J1_9ALTE|nr:TatD family hydrolase [Saliniradius amylolyticus]AWL13258.1 3'-5' ssDNA/RNA exonuclease TatD [Saliniradius amylolyticus]
MYFDIGVNLTSHRFDSDCESVVERALEQGVNQMLITGTDEQESQLAADMAGRYELFSTAGVHPHNAASVSTNYIQHLARLAHLPRVRAIGECGLDFNRDFSPRELQKTVFEQQLELAVELQLPVFLHERDAFDDQLRLLKAYNSRLVGGVAHCFTGSRAQMEAYLDLGLYIGITGWLCDDKRGQTLREAVAHLPLSRLLLETDAPYLAPKTVRPRIRRNEPQYMPVIAQEVARLRQQELSLVQEAAWQNATTLFGGASL